MIDRFIGIVVDLTCNGDPMDDDTTRTWCAGYLVGLGGPSQDALRWRAAHARESGVGEVIDVNVHLKDGWRSFTFDEFVAWTEGVSR